MDLARAPRRTARKKGSGYENVGEVVRIYPGRSVTPVRDHIRSCQRLSQHLALIQFEFARELLTKDSILIEYNTLKKQT